MLSKFIGATISRNNVDSTNNIMVHRRLMLSKETLETSHGFWQTKNVCMIPGVCYKAESQPAVSRGTEPDPEKRRHSA